MTEKKETWNSRLGVILAVAGSAVGLGNFLRFPGMAAQYGGGSFLIAYFISLLILGVPLCWAEWTMGRYGGRLGFNSCPGILSAIWRHPAAKYIGCVGVLIPVVIYMYYVYVEAWCLGYAVNFLTGHIHVDTVAESTNFWVSFAGIATDGDAFRSFGLQGVGLFLIITFAVNFVLIYKGLSKGIELFCQWAMPALVIIAIVVLLRVLTLGTPDPSRPDANVMNGLGFLWNPTKVVSETLAPSQKWVLKDVLVGEAAIQAARTAAEGRTDFRVREVGALEGLNNPQLWLAAAGQIFFSLSLGFGVILTYASYLKPNDDVALSGLTATSANEFCEVALGGLITVPAAVAFLGVAGLAGVGLGTFSLGFKVLPLVFSTMPAGAFFGLLFFLLLYLAAVTSSISMLQPGIAFLEEALGLRRRESVALLGFITALGTGLVVWFSKDVKALDTLDFWVGQFLIFCLTLAQTLIFGWIFGTKRGLTELRKGAGMPVPALFSPAVKYLCPLYLTTILSLWLAFDVFGLGNGELSGYVKDLFVEPNPVAWLCVLLVVLLFAFFALIASRVARYRQIVQTHLED